MLETNFSRESSPHLGRLAAGRPAVLIHCEAPREVIVSRLERRAGRHPQHHDRVALPEVLAGLDEGRFEPLELGIPTLRVNTADGYSTPIEQMVDFCRRPQRS